MIQFRISYPLIIIGIMSGTSFDGLDIAIVEFDEDEKLRVLKCKTVPYNSANINEMHKAIEGNAETLCLFHADFGSFIGNTIVAALKEWEFANSEIDCIASHGHTVFHIPGHSSLQLGDADRIAKICKIPVVHDFRSADCAAGGHGAPLVPAFDCYLARKHNLSNILFHNLGGISNFTYIGDPAADQVKALDSGPANVILNNMILIRSEGKETFDEDGKTAAKGRIVRDVVDEILSHPYFAKPYPKSTGREDFSYDYCKKLLDKFSDKYSFEDILRSSVKAVAESILKSYELFAPGCERIVFSGGGRHNPVLMNDITSGTKAEILDIEEVFGIDSDFKEAVAFAYLGFCRLAGIPSNIPEVTGAKKKVMLGKLAFAD